MATTWGIYIEHPELLNQETLTELQCKQPAVKPETCSDSMGILFGLEIVRTQ